MLEMILVFFKIGFASFGGGWTIVGIIRTEILGRGWMTDASFSELLAIAQITPGPVALNTATMTGFRLYGILGATLATLAVVFAPLSLSLLVTGIAHKYLVPGGRLPEAFKSATFGLLAMTLWAFAPSIISGWMVPAFSLIALLLSLLTKINPVWIILGAGIIGAVLKTIF